MDEYEEEEERLFEARHKEDLKLQQLKEQQEREREEKERQRIALIHDVDVSELNSYTVGKASSYLEEESEEEESEEEEEEETRPRDTKGKKGALSVNSTLSGSLPLISNISFFSPLFLFFGFKKKRECSPPLQAFDMLGKKRTHKPSKLL